jgi:hypothetical protein
MKNKIYLVTESLDIIQKVKTFTETIGGNIDLELQVFSRSSWGENLENPFLRSRLMDKPMLLPGFKGNQTNIEPSTSVSVHGTEIDKSNVVNIIDFPKTGQVGGQVVTLEQLEKAAIIQAIEACRGNLSLAAKSLGLGRATLYRKLKVYSIDPKDMKSKNKRRVA